MKEKNYENLLSYHRTYKNIEDLLYEYISKYDLSETSFWIIYFVFTRKQLYTQSDLCKIWNDTPQTINSSLKKLESDGYVDLTVIPNNKKNKYVSLTSKGLKLATELVVPFNEAESKAFYGLSDEEQDSLVSVIDKLYNNMVKEFEKIKYNKDE